MYFKKLKVMSTKGTKKDKKKEDGKCSSTRRKNWACYCKLLFKARQEPKSISLHFQKKMSMVVETCQYSILVNTQY